MLPKSAFASVAEYEAYLRDWFAGQFAAAAVSGLAMGSALNPEVIARDSYHFADAMLAERERGQ